uniref:Uncharacterized protein n=1 Tax=Podoviridae sp. ctxqo3 TaxID=2827755 RepID=A0A8S5T0C7_9CAUD|nr:MAG TPA: hypothetical protein [Podoviridae sp. ctxqo3]
MCCVRVTPANNQFFKVLPCFVYELIITHI